MPAELEVPDQDGNGGRAGALVAAWLAAKRSPHTRAAYLRDLAQWGDRPSKPERGNGLMSGSGSG